MRRVCGGRTVSIGCRILKNAAVWLAVTAILLAACDAGQLPLPALSSEQDSPSQPESADVVEGWQSGAEMPTARSEMRVAAVDGIF